WQTFAFLSVSLRLILLHSQCGAFHCQVGVVNRTVAPVANRNAGTWLVLTDLVAQFLGCKYVMTINRQKHIVNLNSCSVCWTTWDYARKRDSIMPHSWIVFRESTDT